MRLGNGGGSFVAAREPYRVTVTGTVPPAPAPQPTPLLIFGLLAVTLAFLFTSKR